MKKIKSILIIILMCFIFSLFGVVLEYYYLNSKKMADPVWGLLPKAQDDPETIEEAIVRLIGEHETDAGAHTGAGESLETHKTQEVADHPVGSIVADKESNVETIIKCFFESLDSWSSTGVASLDDLLGAKLEIDWGVTNVTELFGVLALGENFVSYSENMLFQSTFWLDETTNVKAIAMVGKFTDYDNLEGFGFRYQSGALKCFWGDQNGVTFSIPLSTDLTVPHIYRAQYDFLEEDMRFYIDGVLVAIIEPISPDRNFVPDLFFRYEATAAQAGFMRVRSVTASKAF